MSLQPRLEFAKIGGHEHIDQLTDSSAMVSLCYEINKLLLGYGQRVRHRLSM